MNFFPGDYSGGATPVPIPNTEVKPSCDYGTVRATVRESGKLPGIFLFIIVDLIRRFI
jgi:hypothetical protein